MVSKKASFEAVKMGPLKADHPTVCDTCKACGKRFKAGDFVTIVPLGPGDDEHAQERCRAGRPYNAIGAVCHWQCVTGEAP